MVSDDRQMLDRWAECLPERKRIEEFWELVLYEYRGQEVLDVRLDDLLDQFHEINRARLDRERRAVLEEQRDATAVQ